MYGLPAEININVEVLTLSLLVVSFLTLFVVVIVFFKIKKTFRSEEKLVAGDLKLREDLAIQIEDIATRQIKSMVSESGAKIEAEVRKFSEELARVAHAKSTELAAYIEKTQQEQVKESQFFVANMLTRIEKEADEYRRNKLLKVDEQIRQIVLSAAREVIGRSISLTEHEDLVTKALERAKKDQIFAWRITQRK